MFTHVCRASYAGISVEMGVQHDWQKAASKTNSDTSGGATPHMCPTLAVIVVQVRARLLKGVLFN